MESKKDSNVELRTMQKKYAYMTNDMLMKNIFRNLSSCEENLQKIQYLDELGLSSDSDSMMSESVQSHHTGGTSKITKKCVDKILNSKTINEIGILSTDTPPDMSSRQKVAFQRKKLKKYKRMYSGLSSVYAYMKNLANYYYYFSVMSRKSSNDLMSKLNGLNGMVDEWARKVGSDMSLANNKVENIEMVMNILNKFLEKPIDIDLQVHGKVDKNSMKISSQIINGKNINNTSSSVQIGGDFADDYEDAKLKVQQIIENNSFLNDKLDSLQQRMKTVIADNENLFTIRAKVEWITNKLEECVKNKDDGSAVQVVYDLNELMKMLEQYDSSKMVDVIKDIDALISYLEQTIRESSGTVASTIGSMDTAGKDHLEKLISKVTTSLGKSLNQTAGNLASGVKKGIDHKKITTKQRGGEITNLREDYENHYVKLQKSVLDWVKKHNAATPRVTMNEQMFESVNESQGIERASAHSESVTLFLNLKQLEIMMINLEEILKNYDGPIDWLPIWKIAFAHKTGTDMYTTLLQEEVMNFVSNTGTQIVDRLELSGTTDEPALKFAFNPNTDVDDELKHKLNQTYKFLGCLYYMFAKYLLCSKILTIDDKDDADLFKVSQLLHQMDKNLNKSFTHTFAFHNSVYSQGDAAATTSNPGTKKKPEYSQDFTEGVEPTQHASVWFDQEEFDQINQVLATGPSDKLKIEKDVLTPETVFFQEFLSSSNMSLASDPSMSVQGQLNGTVSVMKKKIENLITEAKMMFNRTSKMLGYPDHYKSLSDYFVEHDAGSVTADTYQDVLAILEKSSHKGGSLGLDIVKGFLRVYRASYDDYLRLKRLEKTSSTLVGGAKDLSAFKGKAPRLGNKLETLQTVFKKKMVELVHTLIYLQKKLQKPGDLSDKEEVNAFIKIYGVTKAAVDTANNAFIRILPMIFFAIEYPPHLYMDKNPKTHDYITYNYPEIVFNPYSQESKRTVQKYPGYHQAFLVKTNNNSTKELLNDRLIGLKTITELGNVPNAPVNKVSNIMFAVGASGTGKTVRYFGYRGTNAKNDDKSGIMEFIINANKGSKTVEIAYFVCYGRQNDVKAASSEGTQYDEALLFMKKPADSETFILTPFTTDHDTKIDESVKIDYTNFYTRLMGKKMCMMKEINFENYSKASAEGGDLACDAGLGITLVPSSPKLAPSSPSHPPSPVLPSAPKGGVKMSFREIIEAEDMKIWTDITALNQDELIKMFDQMMLEQRRLRTIMPTINNIDSSRGHTCMLLKMTDQNTGSVSYFPLFDMAGTENIDNIVKFYSDFEDEKGIEDGTDNLKHMIEVMLDRAKVVEIMKREPSPQTIGDDMTVRYTYNKVPIVSLRQIRDVFVTQLKRLVPETFTSPSTSPSTSPNISPVAKKTPPKGSPSPTGSPLEGGYGRKRHQKGGAKNEFEVDVDTLLGKFKADDLTSVKDTALVDKVQYEGAYISHTIALIIFATLCVGETQKSIVNEMGEDTFDQILASVQDKMNKSTLCNIDKHNSSKSSSPSKPSVCGPTMYLYNKDMDYHQILNNSCIWAQIIFSFLYWNNETKDSTKKYFSTYLTDVRTHAAEIEKYTIDMTDPGYLYNFNRDESIHDTLKLSLNDLASMNPSEIDKYNKGIANIGAKTFKDASTGKLYFVLPGQKVYEYPVSGDSTEITEAELIRPVIEGAKQKSTNDILQTYIYAIVVEKLGLRNDGSTVALLRGMADVPGKALRSIVKTKSNGKGFEKSVLTQLCADFIKDLPYFVIAAAPYGIISQVVPLADDTNGAIVTPEQYGVLRGYLRENVESLDPEHVTFTEPPHESTTVYASIKTKLLGLTGDFKNKIVLGLFGASAGYIIFANESATRDEALEREFLQSINSIPEPIRRFLIKNIGKDRSRISLDTLAPYVYLAKVLKEYAANGEEEKETDTYRCQIERVKDPSRNFYPPISVLMHCVTGQNEKRDMVEATLQMSKTLYEAVNVSDGVKKTTITQEVV